MQEMLKSGTTLLYVSHSKEAVEKICENALWLEKGHVKMCGSAEEVCAAYMGKN